MNFLKRFSLLAVVIGAMALASAANAVPTIAGNWTAYFSFDAPFIPLDFTGGLALNQTGNVVTGNWVSVTPVPATGTVNGMINDIAGFHITVLNLTAPFPVQNVSMSGLVNDAGTAMGGAFIATIVDGGMTTGSWHAVRPVPEPLTITSMLIGFGALARKRRK